MTTNLITPVSVASSPRSVSRPLEQRDTLQGAPSDDLMSQALDLGMRGLRIFPVRSPVRGACTCSDPACTKPGKHPHIKNYLSLATQDHEQIEAWWTKWPTANIGVVCGDGLMVIDIDGDDGERWLDRKEVPATLVATSGRGRHLYYEGRGDGALGLGPRVDVIGKNRYVVAPPSLHSTGHRYEWLTDPLTTPMAKLPAWVYEALATKLPNSRTRGNDHRRTHPRVNRPVYTEGERNVGLFRRASAMRRFGGLDDDELKAALAVTNDKRCQPPLPDSEVDGIATSAAKGPHQAADYRALSDLGLIPSHLAVLVTLFAEANAMGECTISYDVLAKKAGVSLSTSQRAATELRRREIVTWAFRPFRSNRYKICDCSSWKSAGTTQQRTETRR